MSTSNFVSTLNRRHFLATTAAAATIQPWSRILGANEDIRIAVAGVNSIGKTHMLGFPKIPGIRVVALCDADSAVLDKRAAEFSDLHGPVAKYGDIRQLFDADDVDAVVLGLPNHWHALGTIWGCQAGKDVYCEKPCSYNIWEANQMQQAADKYQRIVQVGIQRRSNPHLREFMQEVHDGLLGQIKVVRAFYLSRRDSIGKPSGKLQPPATVNHDLWSGPASLDLRRQKYHYDWHWFWETGNGELGNNGPHILDLARWVLNEAQLPKKIASLGGRYGWDDNGETPNTHTIRYEYESAPIIFEITNLPTAAGSNDRCQYEGLSYGIVVEGEKGKFIGFDSGKLYDLDGNIVREIKPDSGGDGGRQTHRENFIAAMKTRKPGDLNCPISEGGPSSSLCHLGNISHRLASSVLLAELPDRIQETPYFAAAVTRMKQHLEANGHSAGKTQISLGAELNFDPILQNFVNQPAADALLRREYRAPYVIHDEV